MIHVIKLRENNHLQPELKFHFKIKQQRILTQFIKSYFLCLSAVVYVMGLIFLRIAFSTRRRTIPLSVLFSKETFTWEPVAAAVSDGSSPLMALSVVVPFPSTWPYGSEIAAKITTDQEQ